MGELFFLIIFFWVLIKVSNDKKEEKSLNSTFKDKKTRSQEEYLHRYDADTIKSKQTKKERSYFSALNEYFSSYSYLNVSEDITLKVRSASIINFEDFAVYKNNEHLSSLTRIELKQPYLFKEIIDKLNHIAKVKQQQGFFNDENRNGVEDSLENTKAAFYLRYFKEIIGMINDTEISEWIKKIILSLEKIKYIEDSIERPSEQIEKLYSLYLPMLQRIMNNYQDFTLGYETSETIHEANTKLISTLSLVDEALENMLSDLAKQDFIDLSIDMNLLESLLKQDGFIDNEFTMKTK